MRVGAPIKASQNGESLKQQRNTTCTHVHSHIKHKRKGAHGAITVHIYVAITAIDLYIDNKIKADGIIRYGLGHKTEVKKSLLLRFAPSPLPVPLSSS